MKKIYNFNSYATFKTVALFFLLMLFSGYQTFAQIINVQPEGNPLVIIRTQEATFSVKLKNVDPLNSIANLTLEAEVPAGFSIQNPIQNGINLAAEGEVIVQFNIIAKCDAPQAGAVIDYTLKDGDGNVLRTGKSFPITLTETDFFFETAPYFSTTHAGPTEYTRVWALTISSPNVSLTNVRITNICNKTALVITKLELVDDMLGTNVLATLTNPVFNATVAGSYIYTFGPEHFSHYGNGNNFFETYETMYVRETFRITTCMNDAATYSIVNGDGVNWCNNPNVFVTHFTVSPLTYANSFVELIHTPPTNATGTGIIIHRFRNTSASVDAIMRNLSLRINRGGSGLLPIMQNVYFVDRNGNSLGLPNLATNLNGNATPVFNFTSPDYDETGLSIADGDGIWNDLLRGDTINIKYEYQYNFNALTACSSTQLFASNYDHRVIFRDNCNAEVLSGSLASPNAYLGFTAPQNATVTPPNILPGTKATLTFYETNVDASGNRGWPISTTLYDHYINVTLPAGFDYDETLQGFRINGIAVAFTDITKDVAADGRTLLIVHIKTMTTMGNTINYSIDMFAKAGITNTMNKEFRVEHEFGFIAERPTRYKYACSNTGLNFQVHVTEGCIDHFSFEVQRMTFGYNRAALPRTRIDVSNIHLYPGVNRSVAGPHDNVEWSGGFLMTCDDPIVGRRWFVDMEYTEPRANGNCFIFPNPEEAVEVIRIDDIGTVQSFFIHENDIFKQLSSGKRLLRVDITPYTLTSASENAHPNMGKNDIVYLVFKMRTTEEMPATRTLVRDITMKGFLEFSGPDDYSIWMQNFWVVDYVTLEINRNGTNYTENNIAAVYDFTRSNSGAKFNAEIFTNEYRPNQYALEYEFNFNQNLNITGARAYEQLLGETPNSLTTTLNTPADYTVTHPTENSTRLKINKLLETEFISGIFHRLGISVSIPCYTTNPIFNGWVDFNCYPTSEKTDIIKRVNHPTNSSLFSTIYLYDYSLTTTLPTSYPVTDEASWKFNLNNLSNWNGSDRVLPNSWLSVEVPDHIQTGSLVLSGGGQTWSGTQFVYYGSGAGTRKYWVKMGNISLATPTPASTTREYTISCKYTSCVPFNIKLTYAMSRWGEPTDPDIGYTGTNAPCPPRRSLTLLAIPELNALRGTVVSPPYDGPNGYVFCVPQTYQAIFTNTQASELYEPILKMRLGRGLELDPTSVIAERNDGASVSIISIDDTGPDNERYVTITLDPTTILNPFGTPGNAVTVDFDLKAVCGFTSGYVAYLDFSAINSCDEILSETKNTVPIIIDGVAFGSEYAIPKAVFSTVNVDGSMDMRRFDSFTASYIKLEATIKMLSSTQTTGDYIAVSVPPNMVIDYPATTLPFTFRNTVDGNSMYVADMPIMSQGDEEEITVVLKPILPEIWSCANIKASIYTGIFIPATCDGVDCDIDVKHENEVEKVFPVKKVALSFQSAEAKGSFHDIDNEKMLFEGVLNIPADTELDEVFIEVYSNKSGTMQPIPGASITILDVITDDITTTYPFANTTPLIIPATEICNLWLVIRKTTTDNQYLCDSVAIQIMPPSYTLNPTAYSTCAREEITVGDAPITGYTYSWSPPDFIVGSSTVTPVKVNYPVTEHGVNALNVTITRGTCAVGTKADITVVELPTVAITGNDKICVGATTTLSPTADGKWTSTHPAIATVAPDGTVTGVSNGAVRFIFESDDTGCSDTTAVVTVIALPVVAITGVDVICVDGTTTIEPNTGGFWVSGDEDIATVTDAGLVTGVSLGTTEFIFTEDTETKCSAKIASGSITVTDKIIPTFPFADDLIYCIDDVPVILPANSTNVPPILGTWDPPAISMTPGTETYTFTPNAGECGEVKTITVTVNAKTKPIFFFGDSYTYCEDDIASLPPLPTSSLNTPPILGFWDKPNILPGLGTETYTFTPDPPDQCAEGKVTVLITVKERMKAAYIIADDMEVCYTDPVIFTAKSTKLATPTFHWYASQTSDMWIHVGATFPAGIFSKDTAFFVSMFDKDNCENSKGDRKKVSLKVKICALIDCGDVLTNRVVEEDHYLAKKYTHSGTGWDATVVWVKPLDDIVYYVNDVPLTEKTLDGFEFPLGLSTVKIMAYYLDIVDVCQFNVYVERACPATIPDDEGNIYKVTKLAGLCWTENLKATKYAINLGAGIIPFAKPYNSTLYPESDNYHFDTFGLLYDWHSAVGELAGTFHEQGICPELWHIPSLEEWGRLAAFPAADLKSKLFWIDEQPGVDKYGFDSRPAGLYNGAITRYEKLYGFTGWWSCSEPSGTSQAAHYFSFNYYCNYLLQEVMQKGYGLSVRCVMDWKD